MKINKVRVIAYVVAVMFSFTVYADIVEYRYGIGPKWVSGAAFSDKDNAIYITDAKSSGVWMMGFTFVDSSIVPLGDNRNPCLYITRDGSDGFLIETTESTYLTDGSIGVRSDATKIREGYLHNGWASAAGWVFGYGPVRSGAGWRDGIVSIEGGKRKLVDPGVDNDFYRVGLNYFHHDDCCMYYIRASSRGTWSVNRIQKGSSVSEVVMRVPSRYVPSSSYGTGLTLRGIFEWVSTENLVHGVYVVNGDVLLMTHHRDEGWLLHNRAGQTYRLPVESPHAKVVVANGKIFVLALGVVNDWGDQDLLYILSIDYQDIKRGMK